jgi:squalene-hopene/tetraprenyl-beta-curcumene cyclase
LIRSARPSAPTICGLLLNLRNRAASILLAIESSFAQTPRVSAAIIDPTRLRAALEKATAALLAERNEKGFWEGELSSSALSTATAVTTLAIALRHGGISDPRISNLKSQIDRGLQWLAAHANADGGWGDTTKSLSNISTTTLCWAAFGAAGADEKFVETVRTAEQWLAKNAGSIDPDKLSCAIIARYGKDRTFSVPILTMCALAGRLGSGRDAWRQVIPLPFELAACPHQLFAALRLPVVSYALPALIAIGQARHVHAPSRNPLARMIRNATRQKTLRVLTEIQPTSGGFLEATPLTSFVTMSLAGSGQAQHVVTQRGLEFLLQSQRADGSWPIDTNLATWCTTLAVEALPSSQLSTFNSQLLQWLLHQQYRVEHPYTHAAPGGWAWTDLSGGVPDADDTAGALLALAKLRSPDSGCSNDEIDHAAEAGIRWLLALQNRDGGIPTFCRGWGALPFDRSSPDITAHALRVWTEWRHLLDGSVDRAMRAARFRALTYLQRSQQSDGSWVPLWFGNEQAPDDENRIYGTSRVVKALAHHDGNSELLPRSISFLVSAQNADGSWGGAQNIAGTMEETALAVEALAETLNGNPGSDVGASVARGTRWLMERVESGQWREPSAIGFYFAKLWYFEKLYPLIFTVGALRVVSELDKAD